MASKASFYFCTFDPSVAPHHLWIFLQHGCQKGRAERSEIVFKQHFLFITKGNGNLACILHHPCALGTHEPQGCLLNATILSCAPVHMSSCSICRTPSLEVWIKSPYYSSIIYCEWIDTSNPGYVIKCWTNYYTSRLIIIHNHQLKSHELANVYPQARNIPAFATLPCCSHDVGCGIPNLTGSQVTPIWLYCSEYRTKQQRKF